MNKAYLEITTCEKCPYHTSSHYRTADSWEHVMEWKCRETGKRVAFMETFDADPGIPDHCPLIRKD